MTTASASHSRNDPATETTLPELGTCTRAVVDYLFDVGPMKSPLIRKDLSPDFRPETISNAISTLRQRGTLTRTTEGEIRLSKKMLKVMQGESLKTIEGALVPRAERNVYGPEITAKHIPSTKGMREGSNDFRTWPSRHV
jgi:hypothetical protein